VEEDEMQTEGTRADPLLDAAAGWLRRFEQYGVQYIALDPDEDRGLVQLLQSRAEWTLDLQEQRGMLFVRSDVLAARPDIA
jgi:hypothetical protein